MQLVITNNFAQSIIILLATTLGIFVVFCGLYYIYQSKFIENWVKKNAKWSILKQLSIKAIMGACIGGACFILIQMQYWFNFQGIIIFYISILLTIGLLFSYISMIVGTITIISYAIPVQLTSQNVIQTLDETTTYHQANALFISFPFILLVIGIIWITVARVIRVNKKTLISFISILIYFGVCLLVTFLILHKESMAVMSIELVLNTILLMLFYIVSLWIVNFFKKIKNLSKAVLYEKNYFLNPIKAEEIIKQKLKTDNVNLGLMVIFGFTNIDKLPIQLGNYASTYIQKILLEKIVKNFDDIDVLFYVTKNNEYACFFFLKDFDLQNLDVIYRGNNLTKRENHDPFLDIYKRLNAIPNNITYDDINEQININANAAIYGLHSCDFNQLEYYCSITKQNVLYSQNKNILQVYNPSNILDIPTNYNQIQKLNKFFNPQDFEVTLQKTDKLNLNKLTYEAHVSSVDHLLFSFDEIKKYSKENNIYEITMRLTAMQTLQEFANIKNNHKAKIILDYPFQPLLELNFNIATFIKKILIQNVNLSSLILRLDLDELNLDIVNIFDKIKDLQNANIEIYFTNFDESKSKVLDYITPDFISIKTNPTELLTISEIKQVQQYQQKLVELLSAYNLQII